MNRLTLSALAAIASASVLAQGTPPGTKGEHWDQETIEIKNNTEVRIEGQVTTKNTKPGNTSSIVLFINGIEKRSAGGGQADHSLTYLLSENGKHNIEVRCSNRLADADKCLLNITRSRVKVFD